MSPGSIVARRRQRNWADVRAPPKTYFDGDATSIARTAVLWKSIHGIQSVPLIGGAAEASNSKLSSQLRTPRLHPRVYLGRRISTAARKSVGGLRRRFLFIWALTLMLWSSSECKHLLCVISIYLPSVLRDEAQEAEAIPTAHLKNYRYPSHPITQGQTGAPSAVPAASCCPRACRAARAPEEVYELNAEGIKWKRDGGVVPVSCRRALQAAVRLFPDLRRPACTA